MSGPPPPPRPLRVAVLIPARDEEEALPPLLAELRAIRPGPDLELAAVLVVDNGSTDGTGEAAERAGAKVVREPRAGYGQACQRGIRALLTRGDPPPDVVVFLDADDLLAPRQLPALLRPIRAGRADLVIGERRAPRGAGVRWHAAAGNRLISWVLRGLYGSRTRDLGPFRAIRWGALLELELDDPDYGWYVQMQVRALKQGYEVTCAPVEFRRRTRGRSKVSGSLRGSVAAGWVMLRTLAAEVARPRG